MSNNPVKCDCGKLIARERDGVLYVWCKRCGKEVAIKKETADKRGRESRRLNPELVSENS